MSCACKSKNIRYLGAGVSGGEEGALKGPSIMPSGEQSSWELVKPIFEAMSAKEDEGPKEEEVEKVSKEDDDWDDWDIDEWVNKDFEEEMEDFDSCLTKTLDVYLEYLKSFVMMIQADSSLLISTYQKNLLEQEWEFVKMTCPHIPGGEAR